MQQTYLNAVNLHQSGQFHQAEMLYRNILGKLPNHPDVLNALGMLCQHTGRSEEALQLLKKAATFKKDAPHIFVNLAETYRTLGDAKQAILWCKKALQLRANNADAYFSMGSTWHDIGDLEQAIVCYRRATQLRHEFPEAHNSLGAALDESGRSTEALLHFNTAVTLAPGYAAAHINLAKTLKLTGDLSGAQQHYSKAIESGDRSISTQLALGELWVELQEYERAVPYFAEVIRLDLANATACNGLGLCEQAIGNREQAASYFEQALVAKPEYMPPLMNLAQNRKFKDIEDPLFGRIKQRLGDPSIDDDSRAGLHYALGKMLDDCGLFDEAFDSFSTGARLTHQMVGRSIDEYRAEFDAIRSIYSTALFQKFEGCGSRSQIPVFIVGMPRSGTTLTEQIIASHPDVVGVGELMLMANVESRLAERGGVAYPKCLPEVDRNDLKLEAEWYLKGLKHFARGEDALRITDKMPHNFLRLGLIALLFPKAKIIHCRRDAMDNCLSIFFQKFVGNGHKYSYDLTTLGQYYLLYEALMQHWHEVLPIDILDVDYEATTADPEAISRQIVDFVGLPWNEACLAPHQLDRTVKTASQWQVRQPIYQTSTQRWKHYEKHLNPLMAALGYKELL